jgi:hypothetical protein
MPIVAHFLPALIICHAENDVGSVFCLEAGDGKDQEE